MGDFGLLLMATGSPHGSLWGLHACMAPMSSLQAPGLSRTPLRGPAAAPRPRSRVRSACFCFHCSGQGDVYRACPWCWVCVCVCPVPILPGTSGTRPLTCSSSEKVIYFRSFLIRMKQTCHASFIILPSEAYVCEGAGLVDYSLLSHQATFTLHWSC